MGRVFEKGQHLDFRFYVVDICLETNNNMCFLFNEFLLLALLFPSTKFSLIFFQLLDVQVFFL